MREEMRSHRELAALAARQHGVVSNPQLRRLGFSSSAIGRSAAAGRLHRLHRGVYAIGHTSLTPHGRCMAAVLACGPEAVLSHFAAAWMWGIARAAPREIDVTVPGRGRGRDSIRVHRAPALRGEDRAAREGIPVTAMPRTLLDLAAAAPRRLDQALESAERLELFDLREVGELLARCGGHRGAARLRRAIADYREPRFTRSELERRFVALIRASDLPPPATNRVIAGFEIDAYWETERFGVELDTYEFHGGRRAFERDRLRQEELKLLGIEIVRVTGRRLDREPNALVDRIARLLAHRRHELSRQAPRRPAEAD